MAVKVIRPELMRVSKTISPALRLPAAGPSDPD